MDETKLQTIRQSEALREEFLKENKIRIRHWVRLVTRKLTDESDDAFSEGLIAFNDAIDSFDPKKGDFFAFAKTAVQHRVTDLYRKEARHGHVLPFSALSETDDNGEEVPFEIRDPKAEISEAALEIASVSLQLQSFSVSFSELAAFSPRARKTRKECRNAVKVLLENEKLLSSLYEKKQIPIKELLKNSELSRKTVDRYRKYIIAGVLIKNGPYPILWDYFDGGKEETK